MRKLAPTFFLLLIPALAAAQQQPEPPRTITVSAIGTVEREPEQGVAVLAVESEAENARAAADANAQKMTRLLAALRRSGLTDRQIRTVSYELRPEYERQGRGEEPPRIVSYRAINMVQVTVDTVARLGGIIDAAIAAGANRVASIRFQLRDPHAAHLEAVQNAVRNARREAEAVAQAAGQRLGPPLNINTGGFQPPGPPMPVYRMEAVDMAAQAATPVESGTLTVTAHVNVVYRIENP
jgi:uncharacterized protein YggE